MSARALSLQDGTLSVFGAHKAPAPGDRATAVDQSYVRLDVEALRPLVNRMPWLGAAGAVIEVAPAAEVR